MIRRITIIGLAFAVLPAAIAMADVTGGETVIIQEDTAVIMESAVSAPPPAWVELESTAIAAGIGARVGSGTLLVAGQEHPFTVKGVSLGDFGIARISAGGEVAGLENVSDFEGRYLAVEAGAAAGLGASVLTMRNDKGVSMTLRGDIKGLQLKLGAEGIDVKLQ